MRVNKMNSLCVRTVLKRKFHRLLGSSVAYIFKTGVLALKVADNYYLNLYKTMTDTQDITELKERAKEQEEAAEKMKEERLVEIDKQEDELRHQEVVQEAQHENDIENREQKEHDLKEEKNELSK